MTAGLLCFLGLVYGNTESQNRRPLGFGILNLHPVLEAHPCCSPRGSRLLAFSWLHTIPLSVCTALCFGIRPWVGAAVVPVLWFYPERRAPRWEIAHLCSPALTPVPGEFSVSARQQIDALEGGSYLFITQTPLKRGIPGVPFFLAFESGLLVPLEL